MRWRNPQVMQAFTTLQNPAPLSAQTPRDRQVKATMKAWHILLIIGLAGVASLLLVPVEQLAPGQQLSFQIRLLMLIQPAMLTVAAVAIGQALAGKAGLGAPLIHALVEGSSMRAVLQKTGDARASGGPRHRFADDYLFGSGPSRGYGCIDPDNDGRLSRSTDDTDSLRWNHGRDFDPMGPDVVFRMGALARHGKGPGRSGPDVDRYPSGGSPFAAGHLPLLFAVATDPQRSLIAAILLANFIPGLLFGWLFWRRGLEAAMLSHAFAHGVNALAS